MASPNPEQLVVGARITIYNERVHEKMGAMFNSLATLVTKIM